MISFLFTFDLRYKKCKTLQNNRCNKNIHTVEFALCGGKNSADKSTVFNCGFLVSYTNKTQYLLTCYSLTGSVLLLHRRELGFHMYTGVYVQLSRLCLLDSTSIICTGLTSLPLSCSTSNFAAVLPPLECKQSYKIVC